MIHLSWTTRKVLLRGVSSIKTAALLSTSFSVVQLFLIGSLFALVLKWHTTNMRQYNFSQCYEQRLCYWAFLYAIPGIAMNAVLCGFMLWPCYILFNNFDLFLESDPRKWLFRPLYHTEISSLQKLIIGWLCDTAYFGRPRAVARVVLNRRLPPEITAMILEKCDESVHAEKESFYQRTEFPRASYNPSLERIRWNYWLRILEALSGSRFAQNIPAQVVLSFRGTSKSDPHSTWLFVFSRDMALLGLGYLVRFTVTVWLSQFPYARHAAKP